MGREMDGKKHHFKRILVGERWRKAINYSARRSLEKAVEERISFDAVNISCIYRRRYASTASTEKTVQWFARCTNASLRTTRMKQGLQWNAASRDKIHFPLQPDKFIHFTLSKFHVRCRNGGKWNSLKFEFFKIHKLPRRAGVPPKKERPCVYRGKICQCIS